MSSIGSITFIKMTGHQIPSLASFVELIDRPGIDGVANRTNAQKVRETTVFTTEGADSLSSANNAADRYAALKGTKVTIVNDLGREVEKVLVIDVWVMGANKILNCSDSNINYIIQAGWLLKPTQ